MPKTTIKEPYDDFLERIRQKMIEAKRSGFDFEQISVDPPVELSGIRDRKVHLHLNWQAECSLVRIMAMLALLRLRGCVVVKRFEHLF